MKVDGSTTNAGWRTVRHTPHRPWTCRNGHECKATHARCLAAGCNDKRPVQSP